MREVIVTGKTVEEATQAACEQLGLPREEVSIEILEMPVRRLFRRIPAKVRACALEVEAELPQPPVPKTEQRKEEPAVKQQPQQKAETQPAKPQADKQAEPTSQPTETAPVQGVDYTQNPKLLAAVEYLQDVFAKMGAEDLTLWVEQQDELCLVKVEGEHVGVLIGHRGETMESLAYLASLVANRVEGDHIKLGLDVACYRGKREKDLQHLAHRMAQKVLQTGRSRSLEPMNAYERRIIHSAVGEIQGVRSESKGDGVQRRVVLYPMGGAKQERGGSRGNRSRKPYAKRSAPERKLEQAGEGMPTAPQRTQHIDDVQEVALYGKIEL